MLLLLLPRWPLQRGFFRLSLPCAGTLSSENAFFAAECRYNNARIPLLFPAFSMMILRQFLVIQALLLWQGGFLFYASFVVPVGTELLGGGFEQGRITRHVTDSLNIVGVIAVALFAWDLSVVGGRYRRWQWGCWTLMALGLLALILLHPRLEALADFDAREISDHRQFRFLHRLYLWISTVQWLAGLGYTVLTLLAWRRPLAGS